MIRGATGGAGGDAGAAAAGGTATAAAGGTAATGGATAGLTAAGATTGLGASTTGGATGGTAASGATPGSGAAATGGAATAAKGCTGAGAGATTSLAGVEDSAGFLAAAFLTGNGAWPSAEPTFGVDSVAADASDAAASAAESVFGAAAFLAADFLTAFGSSGCSSRVRPSRTARRSRRSACASISVLDWLFTPTPMTSHRVIISAFDIPSFLASSCTRMFFGKTHSAFRWHRTNPVILSFWRHFAGMPSVDQQRLMLVDRTSTLVGRPFVAQHGRNSPSNTAKPLGLATFGQLLRRSASRRSG